MIPADIHMRDYQYDLPESRIAKYPLQQRDQSKLLVYKNGAIQDAIFSNVSQFLPPRAHIVFNNTKVIPARLIFTKSTGALIEVFLLEPIEPSTFMEHIFAAQNTCTWKCTIGNRKKWKNAETLQIVVEEHIITAILLDPEQNLVRFTWDSGINFGELIHHVGNIPLPPYMQRQADDADSLRYQTIFAHQQGAVAAPTASLHFTDAVLQDLQTQNVSTSYLTLHVGAGTFLPVKVDNPAEHPMHSEQIVVTRAFVQNLLLQHSCVIPAGTTAMRSVESLYWFGHKLQFNPAATFNIEKLYPYQSSSTVSLTQALQNIISYFNAQGIDHVTGTTEILIMPGYTFKICKGIITNFHQPGSTLLLLIAALIGSKTWKSIYQHALDTQYRFLSYGDSSLLIPQST